MNKYLRLSVVLSEFCQFHKLSNPKSVALNSVNFINYQTLNTFYVLMMESLIGLTV